MDSLPLPHKHLRFAYVLIAVVMYFPVLLLPLPIIIFENPMLIDSIIPTWILCSILILLTVTSLDTILYGISSFKQAIDAMLWVTLFSMISVSTLQNQSGAWPIAVLFFIHSLRSGGRLIRRNQQPHSWWLWLAWGRDTIIATTMLLWTSLYTSF